jgi:dihydropyrimidinase
VTADLALRDVLAILPDGARHVDIEIADGTISAITPAGSSGAAPRTIDGGGREAYPGAIDPHAHFRYSEEVGVDGDGLEDIADAAVRGGITSFIAHVIAPPHMMGMEAVRPVLAHAGSVAPDYGLHYVLYPNPEQLEHLPALFEAGIRSYKMFFAYPERGFMFDGPLALRTFGLIAEMGGLALVHAEEGETIRWVEQRGREAKGRSATIEDFFASRPERLEVAAVDTLSLWASLVGCPLYIVHLSTAPSVPLLRALKETGADITVETCPQYLTLDSESAAGLGALVKFAPVLRPKDHQAALWEGLIDGVIDTIGSDHAGHTHDVKLELAAKEGIFGTPFGIPGIETLFPLLYTKGVHEGRITRERFAEITSTNTARRFGWNRKGALKVGADADIVLVDPEEERLVRAADLRSRAAYSPYEGMLLRGWPALTLRRGEVVFDGQETTAGGGEFLATRPGVATDSGRRMS